MSITTFTELKAAIASELDRTDLTSQIPDFIALAETYFMHGSRDDGEPLRVREMEAETDISPSSNVYALPSDYLGMIDVTAKTSPMRGLDAISKRGANRLYPTRSTGTPKHYFVVGSNLTVLPYTSADIELTYYQTIPALGDSNASNWLLAKMPNLYFRGALMEAAMHLNQPDLASPMKALTDGYISTLNDASDGSRWANGSLVPTEFWA
jgi:hypothetical protein